MPRLDPLSPDQVQGASDALGQIEARLGFLPNSLLTMARRPQILHAFTALAQVVMGQGTLDPGLKSLVAHVASRAAGCRYCMAHTAEAAARRDVPVAKIEAAFEFERSPLFTDAERAALRVAIGAAQVPGAVTDQEFDGLRPHFSEAEIVELMALIGLFGFLNRWNDTLATELEASPLRFARAHLAEAGWAPGKHAPADEQ